MSAAMRAIHHVAIIGSDLDRSRHFYADILGFRVVHQVYRAERESWKCDLALGTMRIELFTFPDAPPRPSRPEAIGLRHLAFAVDDIVAEVARLTRLGVACEPIRVDPYTDRRFTFFADPDGLPLELYEEPADPLP